MNITMLGTGHATVTRCYNTCFVLQEKLSYPEEYFLVDGGGGNTILKQLEAAEIDWKKIRTIFVTHKHLDHLMGVIWLIRIASEFMSCGQYEGNITIYAHDELATTLRNISELLLNDKEKFFLGKRIFFTTVCDTECKTILGKQVTFFDIHSIKTKQYGFCMELGKNRKLTCLGDEPCNKNTLHYVKNSEWLLHEAFCLYTEADTFKPYEKQHSTVKEACEIAQAMNIKNLLLYHTEDFNITNRKQLYTTEGKKYYTGNLFIPNDLEKIDL